MFNTLIKERKKKTKEKKEENSYKNRESHALKTTLAHTHVVVNNTQSGHTNTTAQHSTIRKVKRTAFDQVKLLFCF